MTYNAEVVTATNAATVTSAQGRDWSSFQRPIGSGDLKGLSFGYTRFSDWSHFPNMNIDVNAVRNWKEMKAVGVHRGAYWYFYADGGPTPVEQANFFFAAVHAAGLEDGDMLVNDTELLAANVDSQSFAFNEKLDDLCALNGVHAIPMIYSNNNVGQHLKSCTTWPYWVAWPNTVWPPESITTPWKKAHFWQWGTVGNPAVDADAFNGTPSDLDAWIMSHVPQGPYRQVADGTRSLYGFCRDRNESMDEVIATTMNSTSINPTNLAAFNSYVRPIMPAGMVFYTKTP
jgi:hypothetical protein